MVGCFQLLYRKRSSVLPSEVQCTIGAGFILGVHLMGSPSCMGRT